MISYLRQLLFALALATGIFSECISAGVGQINQRVIIDNIEYGLIFSQVSESSERLGKYALITNFLEDNEGSHNICPYIPDFVEYEGIKYPVLGMNPSAPNGPLYLVVPRGFHINDGFHEANGARVVDIMGITLQEAAPWTSRYIYNSVFPNLTELNLYHDTRYGTYHYNSDEDCKIQTLTFPCTATEVCVPRIAHHLGSVWIAGSHIRGRVSIGPLTKTAVLGCERDADYHYNSHEYYFVCAAPVPPNVVSGDYDLSLTESWYHWDNNTQMFENRICGELHVPAGSAELYKTAPFWKDFDNIIEDIDLGGHSITEYDIQDGLIYGLYPDGKIKVIGPVDRYISEVIIPTYVYFNGNYCPVSEIADFAFCSCENLSRVNSDFCWSDDRLDKVGDYAFAFLGYNDPYTHGLDVLNAQFIGNHAYDGTTIYDYIPVGIEFIGDYAFQGSIQYGNDYGNVYVRKTIILPEGILRIGNCAFAGNSYTLKKLVLPTTVEHIGEYIFGGQGIGADIQFKNSILRKLIKTRKSALLMPRTMMNSLNFLKA